MARQPRKRFFLIFTTEPPAADIVREDNIVDGPLEVNINCRFKWQKTSKETEEIEGMIVAVGTRVRLLTLKVAADGSILPDEAANFVESRKKEIQKRILLETQAKENELQVIAENIVTEGPAALQRRPAVPPVSRLPKKRSEDRRQIQQQISSLPCFTPGGNRVELLTGLGLWMDAGFTLVFRMRFSLKPKAHFIAVMKDLLAPILKLDGVSVTGTRGCEPHPEGMIAKVTLYVAQCSTNAGGQKDDPLQIYDCHKIVVDLLNNGHKRKRVTPPAADQVQPDIQPLVQPHNQPLVQPQNQPPVQPHNQPPVQPDNQPPVRAASTGAASS